MRSSRLTRIGTSLTVSGNGALSTLSLFELCSVGSSFVVGGPIAGDRNVSLATFEICLDDDRILTVAGDVFVRNNSSNLTCIELAEVCRAAAGSGEVRGDGDAVCACP